MRLRRVTRLPSTWLAILALLMVSFAPALSQAVQAARGGETSWFEICSSAGTRWAKAAQGTATNEQAPAAPAGHLLEHCPFCFLHLDAVPVPDLPARALAAPRARDLVPAAFVHAPRTLHAWASAQPRAPPAA